VAYLSEQFEAAYGEQAQEAAIWPGEKLLSPPTIGITEARWQSLRARISGFFPVVKIGGS
jgi:hypothetical protein